MTSGFTTETSTTTRCRASVLVPEEGTDYDQVAQASAAVWEKYRTHMNLPENAPIPFGVIKFHLKDGQIVISWAVEDVTT